MPKNSTIFKRLPRTSLPLIKELVRAGVTRPATLLAHVNASLPAGYERIPESTFRHWINTNQMGLSDIIELGEDMLCVEATEVVVAHMRDGALGAAKYILDRRSAAFKPRQEVTHDNADDLGKLIDSMSMEEAAAKGLIELDDEPEEIAGPYSSKIH